MLNNRASRFQHLLVIDIRKNAFGHIYTKHIWQRQTFITHYTQKQHYDYIVFQ